MSMVGEVMTRGLVTLTETDTLDEADRYLELRHIRHLPVVRGSTLVGLLTHRDLLRNCRRRDTRTGEPLLVKDVMTREVTTVRPETSGRKAIRLMLENKFGCLPVTKEDGQLVGILTEADLLRVADRYLEELDLREAAKDWE